MANEKKRGLGKGISSLMSGFDFDSQTDDIITKTIKDERKDKMTVVQLDIGHVRPNPNQPRKYFDEEALSGLAESIKSQGIIQPLTVEEIAPGEFSIISGERRYRAAKIASLENTDVSHRKYPEREFECNRRGYCLSISDRSLWFYSGDGFSKGW